MTKITKPRFIDRIEQAVAAINGKRHYTITTDDVLAAIHASATAPYGVAWVSASVTYAWARTTIPLAMAWTHGAMVTVRMKHVSPRAETPSGFAELRGFPGRNVEAKLTAWAKAKDAISTRRATIAAVDRSDSRRRAAGPLLRVKDTDG